MTIDWFTIVAQAVNFIILIILMKVFLYKPILNAIDKREKGIAEKLAYAQSEKGEAQKQKEEYGRRNKELNQQSDDFLKKAQDQAQAEKSRLLNEAREAADQLSNKRRVALAEEEKSLRKEISLRTQNSVIAVSRKVLRDLAGTSLEEPMVNAFNRRLSNMDETEKESLTAVLKKQAQPLIVRSAFAISSQLRTSIEASIHQVVGAQTKVNFELAEHLIGGVELNVNGQKVSWSIADYLSNLEEGFDDLLKAQDG